MIKFNSNHIVVGQIKQLLSTFNLPKYRVYTQENQDYHDYAVQYNKTAEMKIPEEKYIVGTYEVETKAGFPIQLRYAPYIKDGEIQYYVKTRGENPEKWEWESPSFFAGESSEGKRFTYYHIPFIYGQYVQNQTKNLKITSNIYDYYTHEYLGDYLRFKRDYLNIDLMSMYNCFSNRLCPRLNIDFGLLTKEIDDTDRATTKNIHFNTADTNFKIYMLPVKLFKKYTIAIDSMFPVEICCGIFGKAQEERDKLKYIPLLTYKKFAGLNFNKPVLYDKLLELDSLLEDGSLVDIAQNEADLKMFIKIPETNSSTVVVLEGDYCSYNDCKWDLKTKTTNKTITNFSKEDGNDFSHFKPISSLQLLRMNTQEQYPFADRLIEYLTDNMSGPEDEISDNIKRAQVVIDKNLSHTVQQFPTEATHIEINGIWEPKMSPIIYDYMMTNVNNYAASHDITGFIDKDVETNYKNTSESLTISGVDLYKEDK